MNNALQRYYVARRTVGGYPYERARMSKTLRNRYVLGKPPVRFAAQEVGDTLDAQDVTLNGLIYTSNQNIVSQIFTLPLIFLTGKYLSVPSFSEYHTLGRIAI